MQYVVISYEHAHDVGGPTFAWTVAKLLDRGSAKIVEGNTREEVMVGVVRETMRLLYGEAALET